MKELYNKNDKALFKEIKEDVNKCNDTPCSCIGRLIIAKMAMLPNANCRFSAIPIKIPVALSAEMVRLLLKSIWNCKGH